MVEVYEDENRWIVARGDESIVVLKSKNLAAYNCYGRTRYIASADGLQPYLDKQELTNEDFNEMINLIRKNAILW